MCSSSRSLSYTKQLSMDLRGDIDAHTIIVRDSNSSLTSIDKLMRQKLNKETTDLNQTIAKINLIILIETSIPRTWNIHLFQLYMT